MIETEGTLMFVLMAFLGFISYQLYRIGNIFEELIKNQNEGSKNESN